MGGAALPQGSGSDSIVLRGLRTLCLIGALPEEFERAQPLEWDLDLELDLSLPGASDALADTVDYGAVCDLVARVAGSRHHRLLEHLAENVARAVLAEEIRVSTVVVEVRKMRPPVPHELGASGVRLRRTRS